MSDEAAIFGPYDNGAGTELHADPLALDMDIREFLGCDPNDVVRASKSAEPAEAIPAKRRLIAAVRQCFRLVAFDPFTGAGITDARALALWNRWADWQAALKKNGAG